ncbi:hypothetical protein SODALDRAFT_297917 [Sodiomyces alkalinus F11]|uniref:Uncharacterized protein n=1 Tax=Sodiomyces alkalinus (strain CBS 110278 / VKM F-3762 / F11) TaxID=1314773 RepID=A0A3N2PTI9_SODAK|nr:hypothetical protein SODALDRAFT_297917 [Sodiomyces alkalinus F11]ROT37636.1 hypothetical protein SODALDRAFT_297917 [Sodiomyces alkalinus F11]
MDGPSSLQVQAAHVGGRGGMGLASVHPAAGHLWLPSIYAQKTEANLELLLSLVSHISADGWLAAASIYGTVAGLFAVWTLTDKPLIPLRNCWQLHAKEALLLLLSATTAVQLGIQLTSGSRRADDSATAWAEIGASLVTIVSLSVVFYLNRLEHSRLRCASTVALLYWLVLPIGLVAKLHSLHLRQVYLTNSTYYGAVCIACGLAMAQLLLESSWRNSTRSQKGGFINNECLLDSSNLFSVLAFSWVTPLMRLGYKMPLEDYHLWDLPRTLAAPFTGSSFEECWRTRRSYGRPASAVIFALIRALGLQYAVAGLIKLLGDLCIFGQPLLLSSLLAFIASHDERPRGDVIATGARIVLSIFGLAVLQTVLTHQYLQMVANTSIRAKGGLMAAIYNKSLRLSHESRSCRPTGDIVNHMAVDTQYIQDLIPMAHQLWSAPLQIVLCALALYRLVGWALLAAAIVTLLMLPLNGWITSAMLNIQEQVMRARDSRSRIVSEMVNNIKAIKLHAWTSAMLKRLGSLRRDHELRTLLKMGTVHSAATLSMVAAPFFMSCGTFAWYALIDKKRLTAEIVFPVLALFQLLGVPLAYLPMSMTLVAQAGVASRRIGAFLSEGEVQQDATVFEEATDLPGDETVLVRQGEFSWQFDDDLGNTLDDINLTVRNGQLCAMVGEVGAGKSSLLHAILGEMHKTRGSVVVRGSVAYASQQPWLLHGTVRDNILFGQPFDKDFYQQTIAACALLEDLAQLPQGDATVIGERGLGISGGQKARVALARAVYARADVYLLDDCLSAVDAHVGRHLIYHVLGPQGLLRTKTRILATNTTAVLTCADYIYLLQQGAIVEASSPKTASFDPESRIGRLLAKDSGNGAVEAAEEVRGISLPVDVGPAVEESRKRWSETTVGTLIEGEGEAAQSTNHSDRQRDEESHTPIHGELKSLSSREVKWEVYAHYAKAVGFDAVVLYSVSLIAAQAIQMGSTLWLKRWAETNALENNRANSTVYIGVYMALGLGSSFISFAQSLIFWIACATRASRKIHERLAEAVFASPMSFFDATPAGRITNRFLGDMSRVDEALGRSINMVLTNILRTFFTLGIVSVSTPAFTLLIIPLVVVYLWVQRYYIRTSRELRRHESATRSPVYAHFQESLHGISTIRAYRQQARFGRVNEARVDAHLRALFPSACVNHWLGIRLEMLGALVLLSSAGFSVLTIARGLPLSPGLVGLAMSYCLQITTSLNAVVRQSVEAQLNIVSLERVLEYTHLPSEAAEVVEDCRPGMGWPTEGAVTLDHYSARYRSDLGLVLDDVSVDIRPGEKIGVVGRTGAGKSSLGLALFRIIEPVAGSAHIDGADISAMGLSDLRSRLAIIPQDGALFEGTLRQNLDPGNEHLDSDLWNSIYEAGLAPFVLQRGGGLDTKIYEGGSNLSQGQRQLVSLARVMLNPSNVVVLDEATASMDAATDERVQAKLKSPLFNNRTVITIAHRIDTVLDYDRILSLERGRVVEFGPPAELLRRQGLFYSLAKEARLVEEP